MKGADLRYGVFEGTQFEDSDLRDVEFQGSWLGRARFNRALMQGVTFGEGPSLDIEGEISSLCYSADGSVACGCSQ